MRGCVFEWQKAMFPDALVWTQSGLRSHLDGQLGSAELPREMEEGLSWCGFGKVGGGD